MGAIKVPRFIGYQSVTLTALYWLGYLINTQLTLIGRIMLLIGAMMIPYCLLDLSFPMGYLGFSLICMYLINFFVGLIFRPTIKVTRIMPGKVICGTPVNVNYTVENTRSIPLWDLKVDAISYQGTSRDSVLQLSSLEPGEKIRETTVMRFSERGYVLLPAVFIESSFPFGLWKWGKFGEGVREIKVMPRPLSIDSLNLPFMTGNNDDDLMDSMQGSGMEFASCREFRYGDNPKHIHWASWARTTVPVIREMTNEGKPSVSLVFDSCYKVGFIDKYRDVQENFELSVSFLAGISQFLSQQNYCIHNFSVGSDFQYYENNQPLEIHDKIMTKCSEIQETRSVEPFNISNFALEKIANTSGLILILQNLDDSRLKLISKIEKSGIPVRVFLLGHKAPEVQGNFTFISYRNLQEGSVSRI